MPSNFGSKFLGEERYQQYVDELTAEGTLDGKKLSPDERKEGFKKRNDKIGFEQFVNKVLERKQSATIGSSGGKALPGGGGGAIVKAPGGGALAKFIQSPVAEVGESVISILNSIAEKLDSIIQNLRDERKLEDKSASLARRGAEREKRDASEKKLEESRFAGLKKTAEKILKPVKGIFDRVFDFIKKIIFGNILMKIIDWFGDKENQKKIQSVFRFIEDFWPALTAAVLLFGTSFGGIVRGLIGTVVKLTVGLVKLIPRFAKFFVSPLGMFMGLGALAAGGAFMSSQRNEKRRSELDAEDDDSVVTPTEMREEGQTPGASQLMQESIFQRGIGAFNKGGLVPGGGPNRDTIPAMLSPGEFVMSRGAVQRYGTSTLESMNSTGGGTNIPEINQSFTTYLKGGGMIGVSGDYKEKTRDPILEKRKSVRAMINAPNLPPLSGNNFIIAAVRESGGDSFSYQDKSQQISINLSQKSGKNMTISQNQIQRKPIGPPTRPTPQVEFLPLGSGVSNADTSIPPTESQIPNFSASTGGSGKKLQTLGIG